MWHPCLDSSSEFEREVGTYLLGCIKYVTGFEAIRPKLTQAPIRCSLENIFGPKQVLSFLLRVSSLSLRGSDLDSGGAAYQANLFWISQWRRFSGLALRQEGHQAQWGEGGRMGCCPGSLHRAVAGENQRAGTVLQGSPGQLLMLVAHRSTHVLITPIKSALGGALWYGEGSFCDLPPSDSALILPECYTRVHTSVFTGGPDFWSNYFFLYNFMKISSNSTEYGKQQSWDSVSPVVKCANGGFW